MAQLVGATTAQCSGTSRPCVTPGNPDSKASYLLAKLRGVTSDMCGTSYPTYYSKMPKSGTITTTGTGAANELQTIIDWVAQGAPQ